jgi:hypothetical protein
MKYILMLQLFELANVNMFVSKILVKVRKFQLGKMNYSLERREITNYLRILFLS